jgi:hypothetical protein
LFAKEHFHGTIQTQKQKLNKIFANGSKKRNSKPNKKQENILGESASVKTPYSNIDFFFRKKFSEFIFFLKIV